MRRRSESDCFADDALGMVAKEIGATLSSVSISVGYDRFATWEAELQQLTERLKKTPAGYGMKITSDKSKIHANSVKPIYGLMEKTSKEVASSNTSDPHKPKTKPQ